MFPALPGKLRAQAVTYQAHQVADLAEQLFLLAGHRSFPHDRRNASVYNWRQLLKPAD
jgi:hypothetical protein